MKGRITAATIRALRQRVAASGKAETLYDGAVAGFAVRARAGGSATYAVVYRAPPGGRRAPKRFFNIGDVALFTVPVARDKARDVLAAVRGGVDPAGERAAGRKAVTMNELLDSYTKIGLPRLKPSTQSEVLRHIERDMRPKLGRVAIKEIDRAAVAKWHRGMTSPYSANRALAYLSSILSFAVRE
ncbi:MAG: DUF4102 domain-containing protein, partial [Alphaproteobacteria bacterium]|nr:DUF4102 domain-containing protein [Alphaproteobacteria bacterium]